ncbi:MAG: dienelactone hydrolase family protein [Pseudomonadales bacterium]
MIVERQIEYEHNGQLLEAYLAFDDSQDTPAPGVLVSHAWGGRDEFACNKARAMAELGYIGFALDLYGKGVRGSGPDENRKLMTPFIEDREFLQSRLLASLETFKSIPEVDNDRIVAMGFCFGGLCVLDIARLETDIRGVISVHGLFKRPSNTAGNRIKAKVLCLHGHDDPMVPPDSVLALEKELTAAGADWQIHVYGNTMHAFTNPKANDPDRGTVYQKDADRRSWFTIQGFLDEVLRG